MLKKIACITSARFKPGSVIVCFISFCMLAACNRNDKAITIKEKIQKQNDILHKVIETKNVNLLSNAYAKEAWYMAPGYPCFRSIDSIKLMWADGIHDLSNMKSTTLAVYGVDEVVTEVGIVEITVNEKDSTYIHKAKYNNVWIKDDDGEYRLKVDIWNSLKK